MGNQNPITSHNSNKKQNSKPKSAVNRQFHQFPNFQSHQTKSPHNIPAKLEEKKRFHDSVEIQNNIQSNKEKNQNFKKDQQTFQSSKSSGHKKINPTSSSPLSSASGLTIEEFLSRYPEVRRLSSRFNEDDSLTETNKDSVNNKFLRNDPQNQKSGQSEPTTLPAFFNKKNTFPVITPKQKKSKSISQFEINSKNKKTLDKHKKEKQERKQREREQRDRENRELERIEREQREREQKEKVKQERLRKEQDQKLNRERKQKERKEREREELERKQRLKLQKEQEIKRQEDEDRRIRDQQTGRKFK